MNGRSVQLRHGKDKVLEKDDPVSLAREFDRYGEIAVIDLDAATGRGENLELIRDILRECECRVGGGIRNVEKAKRLISWGAKKVILGSMAFKDDRINCDFLDEFASGIGRESIIIAVDALNKEIVTDGWRHTTGINLHTAIKETEKYCSEFLFTCVEKEGTMEGVDLEMLRVLTKITENKITFAGGIGSVSEIKALAGIGIDVQIGMAIYTGKISLSEAFIESLDFSEALIPTIAVAHSGEVLMLSYSDCDSLKKTFETGNMWYYSRSKNSICQEGEVTGNIQELVRIRPDCGRVALLATVKQKGKACHTGSFSCFGDRKNVI
jgi:phosphoribosyl-ATP pyrophosphohydrolase/phosphoribosyl-AMP cyclohydrolase